jgi:hypothetical protein
VSFFQTSFEKEMKKSIVAFFSAIALGAGSAHAGDFDAATAGPGAAAEKMREFFGGRLPLDPNVATWFKIRGDLRQEFVESKASQQGETAWEHFLLQGMKQVTRTETLKRLKTGLDFSILGLRLTKAEHLEHHGFFPDEDDLDLQKTVKLRTAVFGPPESKETKKVVEFLDDTISESFLNPKTETFGKWLAVMRSLRALYTVDELNGNTNSIHYWLWPTLAGVLIVGVVVAVFALKSSKPKLIVAGGSRREVAGDSDDSDEEDQAGLP